MSAEVVEVLTATEEVALEDFETRITKGLRSFRDVGDALAEIRDRRLYRAGYVSFEAYCEAVWGMTRRTADRQIMAAEVADILEVAEVGPIGLTSESQARELAPLRDDPDAMRAAYEEAMAAASGEPTAEGIRKAVKARTVKPAPPAQEDPGPAADPDPGPPEPQTVPPVKTRTAAEQKVAERAYDAARSLTQYRPEQVDEKTVRLLEAWCLKWRNQ